jgi:hypothetical protein
MDLTRRWPILRELCSCAEQFPDLQIWVFGSMLRSQRPRDLDVLIIYADPQHVTALYAARLWEATLPLLHFIAMTPDEERDYRFIEVTGAVRLHPPPAEPAAAAPAAEGAS